MGQEEDAPAELSSHDRILQSARTLFSQQGYENTTTSAISRMAGTSESQLIKHFGSKEGLLEAIFDHGWKRMGLGMRQALEQVTSPIERLQLLMELMLDAFEKDKALRTLMLLEGRRIRKHGHMVVLTRGFLQIVEVVDAVLKEMQEAGKLRAGLNLESIRSALIGAFEGMLRDQLLAERSNYPAHFTSAELRATFGSLLACFLEQGKGGKTPPAASS